VIHSKEVFSDYSETYKSVATDLSGRIQQVGACDAARQ
jgi:hypothetical protein